MKYLADIDTFVEELGWLIKFVEACGVCVEACGVCVVDELFVNSCEVTWSF